MIKQSLRELRSQLELLNHQVRAHLDLKDVDLDCLDLINQHGPLSPSALARHVGLHPLEVGDGRYRQAQAERSADVQVRLREAGSYLVILCL